jgi:DNA invertase Pin-like site-specific DNA recombinase
MTSKTSVETEKKVLDLYEEGLSIDKIRKKLSIGKNTVHRILRRNNVVTRSVGGKPRLSLDQKKKIKSLYESGVNTKVLCKKFNCSRVTITLAIKELGGIVSRSGCTKYKWTDEDVKNIIKLYKSEKSQTYIADLYNCDQTTISRLLIKNNISFHKYRKEKHPNWSGGRHITREGYVIVLLDNEDPFYCMVNSSSYILEHRLVMARYLKRPLNTHETVHHIDGNRQNNNIHNLQLRHNKHGNGICYQCVNCGSFNIKNTNV